MRAGVGSVVLGRLESLAAPIWGTCLDLGEWLRKEHSFIQPILTKPQYFLNSVQYLSWLNNIYRARSWGQGDTY